MGGWYSPYRTSRPSTPVPAPPHTLVLRTLVQGLLCPRRLGRRKVLILSHLQLAASGTCTAFAPSFPIYCAFRLLSGMSTSGIILNSMTLSEGCWEVGGSLPPLLSPLSPFPAHLPELCLGWPLGCPPDSSIASGVRGLPPS